MITQNQKDKLFKLAKENSGENITPASNKTWDVCFVEEFNGWTYLYYNDESDSTLMVRVKTSEKD